MHIYYNNFPTDVSGVSRGSSSSEAVMTAFQDQVVCYLGPLLSCGPEKELCTAGRLRVAIFIHASTAHPYTPPRSCYLTTTNSKLTPKIPLRVMFYFLSRMVVSEVFILLCFIIYVHVTYIHFECFDTINKKGKHTYKKECHYQGDDLESAQSFLQISLCMNLSIVD